MTKRKISIIVLLCMFLSMVIAANVEDIYFTYSCSSMTGNTGDAVKTDASKVYLYPTSGTYINYKVMGRVANSTTYINACGYHQLGIGTQYSLTNMAYEWGLTYVRLNFSSPNVPATVYGVWSPDSLGTYTVVPLGL